MNATPRSRSRCPRRLRLAPLPVLLSAVLAGCGGSISGASDPGASAASGQIAAVGAENQYANVIGQIGGEYVKVSAIERNPNTDPHTFEASPSVAEEVSGANLIVENGLGYDTYMEKIESASPSSSRAVINVQHLLGLPDSTANPHLWYKPATMPALAAALAGDLSRIQPAHASYFQANERRFDQSLTPWLTALKQFSSRYPDTTVATTEPVADYMLEAAGVKNLTPFTMQADIMNDTDPAPQAVSEQDELLEKHHVEAFLYNQQVTDSVTEGFLKEAAKAGIPVVAVYETMPTPGYDYQSWMLAELTALERAVSSKTSTRRL